MKFRPCIDIHNGAVKQIVGSSLRDEGNQASDNFVSEKSSAYYARLYKEKGLFGGHVILLNSAESDFFAETKAAAMDALGAFPGGLMVGGGINADNANEYLLAGASHVVVTSFVFSNGRIRFDRLESLRDKCGKDRIVLDLSCRKRDGKYYVVTDRWQNFTDEEVTVDLFDRLCEYADEFLIHGVDVEGMKSGIDEALIAILARSAQKGVTMTYAGGISTLDDIDKVFDASNGFIDITIGSALDTFGGDLKLSEVLSHIENRNS